MKKQFALLVMGIVMGTTFIPHATAQSYSIYLNKEIDGERVYNQMILAEYEIKLGKPVVTTFWERYTLVKVKNPDNTIEWKLFFNSFRDSEYNKGGNVYLDIDGEVYTLTDATPYHQTYSRTVNTVDADVYETGIVANVPQKVLDALKTADSVFVYQYENETTFAQKEMKPKAVKALRSFVSIPPVRKNSEASKLIKQLNGGSK